MTAPLLFHVFSTFATGGPQVRFAAIANQFGSRWRHAIVAMDGDTACRERLDPALDVTFPSITFCKGDTLGNARIFRGLLRIMRPSVLITSNWGTIEWAIGNRLCVVPHVHVEDGFGPEERENQLHRRVLMRRVFLAGRTVAVPSLTLRRIAIERWRLAPARVRYVPNGIDLTRFTVAERAVNSVPVIGTVAALRPEKNIGRLLRAFAAATATHPANLRIVGDGPERAGLQALAGELGIAGNVEWCGHQPDPAALLRTLDIYTISSDTEQMPISLLEAMASGLPVAGTAVGDVAAMLPAEQAAFVVPLDDGALAGALSALLRDPALRARLGTANRARAEAEFGQARMFDAWAELWTP